MFNKRTLLITGGTGSFGNAVLRRMLQSEIREIRIFSRDEKKQDDMRKRYNNPKLKFYIGDVRDQQSVINVVRGVDYIYHAAALKQVPSCEFHPLEAVKTNVLGTENVLEAAIQCGIERVVCLSTDKAVYPINAMGISKAMMEKVAVAKSRCSSKTVINVTRYGNVMASRGSVIPLFIKQIREGRPITTWSVWRYFCAEGTSRHHRGFGEGAENIGRQARARGASDWHTSWRKALRGLA
jgi:UDP-glucose 4-epimerase